VPLSQTKVRGSNGSKLSSALAREPAAGAPLEFVALGTVPRRPPSLIVRAIVSAQFEARTTAASPIAVPALLFAPIAALTIMPTNSQSNFPLQLNNRETISAASAGRAVTAAEVIAGASLRRCRTARQTAESRSILLVLFKVCRPDKPC